MGVKIKPSDIAAQWGRHELAKVEALKAETAFSAAANAGRPDAGALWVKVGEAVRTLNSEWAAYQKIAPAKVRTKR